MSRFTVLGDYCLFVRTYNPMRGYIRADLPLVTDLGGYIRGGYTRTVTVTCSVSGCRKERKVLLTALEQRGLQE